MQLGESTVISADNGPRSGTIASIFWSADEPINIGISVQSTAAIGYSGPALAVVTYHDPITNQSVTKSYPIGGFSLTNISIVTGVPKGSPLSWGEVKVSIVHTSLTPEVFGAFGLLGKALKAVGHATDAISGVFKNQYYVIIYNNLSTYVAPECFGINTRISYTDGTTQAITKLSLGDLILAFDPTADSGRGALTEKRVTKLYRNVTREWIELDLGEIDPETGAAKTLTCTPGHHFLDEFGQFPTIAEMLLRGGGVARIVMEDGSIRTVTGKRIVWSEQNAHLYGGRARQAGWTDGSVALA